MASNRTTWNVKSSDVSKRAHNPIRHVVDKLKVDPQAQKSFISLSVGVFYLSIDVILKLIFGKKVIPLFSETSTFIKVSTTPSPSSWTHSSTMATHLLMVKVELLSDISHRCWLSNLRICTVACSSSQQIQCSWSSIDSRWRTSCQWLLRCLGNLLQRSLQPWPEHPFALPWIFLVSQLGWYQADRGTILPPATRAKLGSRPEAHGVIDWRQDCCYFGQ